MAPEIIFFVALAVVLFGAGCFFKSGNKNSGENILSQRCRAPLWTVLQSLDTLVHVRMPINQYPLSRYWLEPQDVDYQRGRISAYLEFVEEVVPKRILGIPLGARVAVMKKYGFIWLVDEVLSANQVELVVSLVWKDLTSGKTSRYEPLILRTILLLTREIIARIDQSVKPAPAAPISGPPPTAVPTVSLSGNESCPPPATGTTRSQPSSAAGLSQNNKLVFRDMASRASRATQEEQNKRLVEWPCPLDFHEAVQNPSSCFADELLRKGRTDTDALGMPRVTSGAFASVYRICCQDKDRAVRCFLHPVKDQKQRYEILQASVSPAQLPWIVEFEYADHGICLNGKWYPILTMDWVEGTPLNAYVSTLCDSGDVDAIENLRLQFSRMVGALRGAHIAHGDLQHGNILVQNGQLMLVDYDGMFVPQLSNRKSNELGHANYQHPARLSEHFDETLDHFSTWVIDTALLCLREDPGLFRYYYDDGESLLFHRQDFIRPDRSSIMTHLAGHSSALIKKRAKFFSWLLRLPFEQVPPLDASLKEASAHLGKVNPLAGNDRLGTGGLPDWLSDVDY